nr:reverse transcriptase domain-containing protein [Tanacetum cinerariifolium]
MVAATEPKTIQKAVQIAGTLTDEALRNGTIKKNLEKKGNGVEPSKDRNEREDNKRTRTENAFASTANLVGEVTWGHRNQGNQARGRAFILGAEEARHDPNIMMGMDWLSNHKAEIICHEKVVRIPLLDGKEIEFRIELILGAMPVAKSPYRLAPFKLEELSGQLKELQDKAALSLSSLHQIVVGKYCIRIPLDDHQEHKSSKVRMSRICFTSLQIETVRVGLRKVEPLLVAFNSQLKVFHSPFDDNAPGKHS